ncbi:hypothetical protein [Xanthobacter sp. 91]|uniref:hypothetical protein n=2 Tax=Xanthobacter sp. 91 TaxID=1117244 RepID=UPI000B0FC827|nr:hypothetical protein [Xanthobacter sp. 91]
MSAYLNALAEEGTREDLLAQIARLTEDRAHTAATHSARVAELLEANNREVEKRRIAERALDASSFQRRVGHWMQACFGPAISADRLERGDRLLEEVLELLQSGGYPPERVAALTGYVWSRPAGEPPQEAGGVKVTLAAYCLAHEIDMHLAGETELARIWTKVEAIRAKQAAKPTGSALPMAWANLAALARDAIPEMKLYPAEHGALRASIAELDAWLDSSDALDEIENQQSFGESIILVVHELKRLQAIFTEEMKDKAVHSDDIAVDRFASAMKTKLAQKRAEGKGGWEDKNDCPAYRLSGLLRDHVSKGDPVDVANFCMMLHQRGEKISVFTGSRDDTYFAAVVEAREDAKGKLGTLREAMRIRRERDAGADKALADQREANLRARLDKIQGYASAIESLAKGGALPLPTQPAGEG